MPRSSDELLRNVMALYEDGQFRAALDELNRGMGDFSDSSQMMNLAKICLHAVIGNPDQAIQTLAEALEDGIWYPEYMLRNDPHLAILQGDAEFERLVRTSVEKQAAAEADAYPDKRIVSPDLDAPAPLFIALHGNNVTADGSLGHWAQVTASGWHLLLPQSSQASGQPGTFVWTDRDRAVEEVSLHYEEAKSSLPLSGGTVIAGFSRGAGTAVWMALTGRIPVQGFIAVAPAIRQDEIAALRAAMEEISGLQVRGCFVVGDRDRHATETVNQLADLMQSRGLACHVARFPDLGHEFPSPFDGCLAEALAFIDG